MEAILKTNHIFLERLSERVQHWSNSQKISDIFLGMLDMFKLYAPYVNNFDRSLATYEELKKNPAFQEWIRPRYSSETDSAHTTRENVKQLNSLLIMPIQRIPSKRCDLHIVLNNQQGYNLLLKDLIKNTWKFHIDYAPLCKVLERMEQVCRILETFDLMIACNFLEYPKRSCGK